jgi:hypothetical protein
MTKGHAQSMNFKKLLRGALCVVFLAAAAPGVRAQEKPAPATEEDTTLPAACAATSDRAELEQKTPELARYLDVLQQLPLTGAALYARITDPAGNITSCLFPMARTDTTDSSFEGGTAHNGRGMGAGLAFHEYFHAGQYLRDADKNMSYLTAHDARIQLLLKEASAIAFDMATRREAANHGIAFPEAREFVETKPDGTTVTYFRTFVSTSKPAKAVFNAAYDRAWKLNAKLDPQKREAKALEAGGRAIVSRLMHGREPEWTGHYVRQTEQNIADNAKNDVFLHSGRGAAYARQRAKVFLNEGFVSPDINFVPPEYLGPAAEAQAAAALKALGFPQPAQAALTARNMPPKGL